MKYLSSERFGTGKGSSKAYGAGWERMFGAEEKQAEGEFVVVEETIRYKFKLKEPLTNKEILELNTSKLELIDYEIYHRKIIG